ncbi:MAG TPA: VIT and VWA domain-containing protein [Gammaproteobacteria bacterium]|nr:VIT and VWA domain-containing protein [Gammaproteobacteria bacterium]
MMASSAATKRIERIGYALLGAAVALLGACANPSYQSGAASTGSAQPGGQGLDEITVTGSRVYGPSGSPRRVEPRDRQATLAVAPANAEAGGESIAGMRPGGSTLLSQVQPGEEIWVIQTSSAATETEDDEPGSGTMLALVAPARGAPATEVPLPLRHTDVHAVITGYISAVDVTQQFENPYDEKIEAVYLFPLPEKAAVNEFVMTIGQRKIRGILREREEAQRIYEDARAQGYRASLLVQHRPNIFEQKVANIEPGKRIDVNIRYFHTLAYEDGWYSFVFPTVVGPPYNPLRSPSPVAALPREEFRDPPIGTAVRYLRPSERSAHDLGIAVDVDAGVQIEELAASHEIATSRDGESRAHVTLAAGDTIPNRDFILKFRVAGETIKSNLLTYTDERTQQGYFTLLVYPPRTHNDLKRQPLEMVFVVDTSGSMAGAPIGQARDAINAALVRLDPRDTFQIMNFSNDVRQFASKPLPATYDNIERARDYVRRLGGDGGTEMLGGIRAALGFPRDPERTRYVTFLTDGYIGNEAQILGEVQRTIGDARIFSFGVGNSVNRYLLDGLATEGRGTVAYLGLEDSAADVMDYYFERISRPALTDVAIDWDGLAATDVYPTRLPDLFPGRPIVVTGKFRGTPDGVAVRGRLGAGTVSLDVAGARDSRQPALRSIWARLRIEELARRQTLTGDPNGALADSIRATALEHSLMSAYTSFVAVDATERTAGERGTTVNQAVPVPAGVRYDTTVSGERRTIVE